MYYSIPYYKRQGQKQKWLGRSLGIKNQNK